VPLFVIVVIYYCCSLIVVAHRFLQVRENYICCILGYIVCVVVFLINMLVQAYCHGMQALGLQWHLNGDGACLIVFNSTLVSSCLLFHV